jgi:hypothetical protein
VDKHKRLGIGASLFVIGLVVGGLAIALRGDAQPHLAGAELMAGAGHDDRPIRDRTLDDLRLDEHGFRAVDIRSSASGELLVITALPACLGEDSDGAACSGFVIRYDEDLGLDDGSRVYGPSPGQLALAPDGEVVRVAGGSTTRFPILGDSDFESGGLPFGPYSGDFLPDGTLVLAARDEPWIAALHPDGSTTNLIVPVGNAEDAPVRFDSTSGRLSVVVLPDGRIAFAANAPDDPDVDGQIYILDGATLTPVDTTSTNAIRRIFPGPDDTLLALDGPNISQLDPDTGHVDQLIDLSEIADELAPANNDWPTDDQISATPLGDDLVFTADNRIWRLPDAFA